MKFGLEQHIIDKLIAVFEQNSKVDKALVFGSRAMGNYRPDSDIDIALKGQDLNTDDIIAMSVAFEEKGITHKIDLINYDTIKEPDLKEHIDRVGLELYSRWMEVKLGDVVKFGNGKERPKIEGEIPVYGGNGILGYTNQSNYEGEVLIIGRVGAYCGSVYYENKPIWISDNALSAKPKNNYNAKFLYYFLKNLQLNNQAQGSSHPLVTQTLLNSIEVVLTDDIQEQTAIASILSSLDDKIDLLHRQNKTLEQLAETLFRQWFVEKAEESWEVQPLGKVFDIGIGRTPPRKEQHWFTLNPNDVKWVSIKDMGTSGIYIDTVSEYLTREAIEQYSVPIIPENSVMLSFKMTIGRLAISTERMVSNEAIAHFKQKEGSFLFPEFLYLFLKTYSWVELGSTSSIVESINSQMIKEIEMIIPDNEKLVAFKEIVKPSFDKIKSNQTQIRTLTNTLDNLLPKLMSGEVRVNL